MLSPFSEFLWAEMGGPSERWNSIRMVYSLEVKDLLIIKLIINIVLDTDYCYQQENGGENYHS
ncbi:MAG: hypothetical protein ABFC91_03940 [Methanobacteriaceae archaeon]